MARETPKPLVVPDDLPPILAEPRDELEFLVSTLGLQEPDPFFTRLGARLRPDHDPALQVQHVMAALGRATATALQKRGGTPGRLRARPLRRSLPHD